jgi:hypothetical protein
VESSREQSSMSLGRIKGREFIERPRPSRRPMVHAVCCTFEYVSLVRKRRYFRSCIRWVLRSNLGGATGYREVSRDFIRHLLPNHQSSCHSELYNVDTKNVAK